MAEQIGFMKGFAVVASLFGCAVLLHRLTHPTKPPPAATDEAARPDPPPSLGLLRAVDFGEDWPLTVPEGVVSCMGRDGLGFAIFEHAGMRYALNGAARAPDVMAHLNLRDIKEIAQPGRTTMSILDRALALCPK